MINSELLNLQSFKNVIVEGEKHFPHLEFPIRNITRGNLNDILTIIELKMVDTNKYMLVIPLITKNTYDIFQLIPLPVSIQPHELMIADIRRDIVLKNYMLTSKDKLLKIQNDYILTENLPVWSQSESSCQLDAFKGNNSEVIRNCQFRRLGNTHGLYLTSTKTHKIIYSHETIQITAECPSGIIRQDITGLHIVPNTCAISTDNVNWPAVAENQIKIKEILHEANGSNLFDITSLPIFEINTTNPLHNSIKNQIKKLTK